MLERLVAQEKPAAELSAEERARILLEWTANHAVDGPPLSDYAVSSGEHLQGARRCSAMTFLVDTNVLLRMIQQRDSMYADARRATATLIRQNHQLSIIAQNLIEFWAVATRPASSNGLALSVIDTAAHIKTFKQTFTLLPDTPDIFPAWERLVELHSVVHQVTHILTFNTDDFKRYAGDYRSESTGCGLNPLHNEPCLTNRHRRYRT